MTRRPIQQYDEQTWRYVLVPMSIWTVGIVGVVRSRTLLLRDAQHRYELVEAQ